MITPEIQSFLNGEFRSECYRIEIKRNSTYPLAFTGPGIIEQDKNYTLNFRIHVDEHAKKKVLEDLRRPRNTGKLISADEYFLFTAYAYNLPIWNAHIPILSCTMSLVQGGVVHGQLAEICQLNNDLGECKNDSAKLYFREKIEFPETGVTETEVTCNGKSSYTSSNRDCAQFNAGEEEFELFKRNDNVELICTFEKGGIADNKHIRIQEALQFSLGQRFQPCALELRHGKAQTTVLRSTEFRGDNKVQQMPPLTFSGKAWRPEVYEITKKFYSKISEHKDEKWHPVSSQVYYLLQAGSSALELQCLALGVAAEGIAGICHASLVSVSDEFKDEVDRVRSNLDALDISETLRNRINGAVNNMKAPRGADRIREFVKQKSIDPSIFKSWQRVRNAAAHGGMLETNTIETTLNDLNNVLYLCYAMLLSFVDYDGIHSNYSCSGFPDKPLDAKTGD